MNHSGYSNRSRSRSKQPIYTSDKRAKFTQRENKKWLRLLTVLGYVVFVSAPAISLSIYYVHFWKADYIRGNITINRGPQHMTPILPKSGIENKSIGDRNPRDLSSIQFNPSIESEKKCTCESNQINEGIKDIKLETLLKQHASEKDQSISSESELFISSSSSSESIESP